MYKIIDAGDKFEIVGGLTNEPLVTLKKFQGNALQIYMTAMNYASVSERLSDAFLFGIQLGATYMQLAPPDMDGL